MNKDNVNILIVDDDSAIRDFLKLILNKAGYVVEVVSSGLEGWEFLSRKDHEIKVILLDRLMPKMGGLELLGLIRNDPDLKDIQVILQTGLSEATDVAAGTNAGANRYITKPLNREVVLAMVRSCLKDYDHLNNVKYLADLSEDFKTKMLSIFSHGIKTPLNGILGFTQFLLEENQNLDGFTFDYLKIIKQSGERINNFVEDALLLISLKAEKVDVTKCCFPMSIQSIFQGIVEEFDEKAEKRGVNLCFSCDCDLEQNWRWELVDKAFRAVLDNAIKFTARHSQVVVNVNIIDQECRVEVMDQGPGIPYDAEGKIFQLFEVQNVLNLTEGFGISLILCRQILRLFGGRIIGENREEGGAVFTICLPLTGT